ncbi:hypothetical protein [Paenibacillus turpanensis]|uniref:hypothetical protein n=1 Tax=Paenibacillus turpanensis TaxID=2689078 RepID=UPI00140B122F|nr:hypothetical protein [Paenibacillus turpanensis]
MNTEFKRHFINYLYYYVVLGIVISSISYSLLSLDVLRPVPQIPYELKSETVNNRISQAFYNNSNVMLDIMAEVYVHLDLYTETERTFKNKYFDDDSFNQIEKEFVRKIMKIDMDYHNKLNIKDISDPSNEILVKTLLEDIQKIKSELEQSYGS